MATAGFGSEVTGVAVFVAGTGNLGRSLTALPVPVPHGELRVRGPYRVQVGHPAQPVESIVTYLPTGQGGAQEKWEYAQYSDNPQFWTDPSTPLPAAR